MSLARLLTRRATLVHVAQTADVDEYGNPQTTETSSTVDCYVEPRNAPEEQNVDRATTQDDWLLIVPEGTELSSVDRIELDELGTFYMYGEPWPVWNPRRGQVGHIEARLRRTGR